MNKRCCICFVSLTLSASVSSAPLEEIFKNADYDKELSLRHRIENVRDTAFSHNALASTLRTRIGMSQTVNTKGLQFLLQADGVTNVGSTTYNTLSNGEDSHPVVSDPSFIEMNQAWLGYNVADTQVIAGRQVINILNERFIGSDAFRQNEQTYDAITVDYQSTSFLRVQTGHIYNVNRVIDPQDPLSDIESTVQYAVASVSPASWFTVSPYGYWMDLGDERSNNTYGVQLTGEVDLLGKSFHVLVDWATQSAGSANFSDYSADYLGWKVTTEVGEGAFSFGIETMMANPDGEFQTPLASLHDFNGWADRFNYGAGGLGVSDIGIGYLRHFGEGVYAEISYHAYSSAADQLDEQMDYGDEWGWRLAKRFDTPTQLEFGFVKYRAEEGGEGLLSDHVQRLWLGYSHQF